MAEQLIGVLRGHSGNTIDLSLATSLQVVGVDSPEHSAGQSLPSFPTDRYEQPLAIEPLLLVAGRPMDAAELARGFKRGGTRIERRIAQVLTTLARYGRVIPVESGKYAASRAA